MKRLSEHYKFSRVEFSLKDVEDEKTRRAIRDLLSDLTVLYANLAKMLNELGLLTTEYLDQEVKTTSSPEFSTLKLSNLPAYTSNADAIAGGLSTGDLYRNVDNVCVVH